MVENIQTDSTSLHHQAMNILLKSQFQEKWDMN